MEGVARFGDNLYRFECLYFTDREVLKLYQPQSVRQIGGRSTDRVLSGNVGFVLHREVSKIGTRRWLGVPASLSLVPIMNFPALIENAALLAAGEAKPVYVDELHKFLRDLPSTCAEVRRRFGENFFSLSRPDRLMVMAQALRASDSK